MSDKRPWYSPRRLAQSFYSRRIRPYLPAADRPIYYAGIPGPHNLKVGDGRFAKLVWGYLREDQPGYEKALIEGLCAQVRPSDRVVVIGGGMGITAAMAAHLCAPDGQVVCYEGDFDAISTIRRTAQRNAIENRLTIHAAIVGAAIGVYGDHWSRMRVAPQQLPDCDVLEMDCEGSETGILRDMTIRPRAIIVETHGLHGAPTADVAALLDQLGYDVSDLGWAEPRAQAFCEVSDIRVLVGVRRSQLAPGLGPASTVSD